jgi:hypothetical protein
VPGGKKVAAEKAKKGKGRKAKTNNAKKAKGKGKRKPKAKASSKVRGNAGKRNATSEAEEKDEHVAQDSDEEEAEEEEEMEEDEVDELEEALGLRNGIDRVSWKGWKPAAADEIVAEDGPEAEQEEAEDEEKEEHEVDEEEATAVKKPSAKKRVTKPDAAMFKDGDPVKDFRDLGDEAQDSNMLENIVRWLQNLYAYDQMFHDTCSSYNIYEMALFVVYRRSWCFDG